jgi:hypothetical protein
MCSCQLLQVCLVEHQRNCLALLLVLLLQFLQEDVQWPASAQPAPPRSNRPVKACFHHVTLASMRPCSQGENYIRLSGCNTTNFASLTQAGHILMQDFH